LAIKKSACGQGIIHSGEDRPKIQQKGYKKLCLWTGPQALSMQKKNFRVQTFRTCFRPKDSQLLAQSLMLCLAIVVHIQKENQSGRGKNFRPKTSDLGHIQFLCGKVCVGVRVKVRVNTKNLEKRIYRGTGISTSLLQDFSSVCTFRQQRSKVF
jgi:hypothetical protein